MSFKKRETSAIVNKANIRLSGMKEIDKTRGKTIEYGGEDNVVTSETVENQIKKINANMDRYNRVLQEADGLSNDLQLDERKLNEMLVSVLSSGKSKFGADSNEIEKLGGTRKSDRKKKSKLVKMA